MMTSKVQGGGGGTVGQGKSLPPSFANLNVRELFETQSVDVTKETKRKVKQEIERKREELRVLVGERYRDLIDAADTIGTMRSGSAEVFHKLTQLRTTLIALPTLLKNGQQQIEGGHENEKLRLNEQELEFAAEVKLSSTIPRQILVCLENEDVIGALHLTLLFKQKLGPRWKLHKSALQSFSATPEYEDQKNLSDEIVQSLLNKCEAALEDFFTPSEHLAECIIVKQTLKGCSCEEVIVEFLSRRVTLCGIALETSSSADFVTKVATAILSINQIFIDPELYNAVARRIRKTNILPEKLGFMSTYTPPCLTKINAETIPVQDPPRVTVLAEAIMKHYVHALKTVVSSKAANSFFNLPQTLREMEELRTVAVSILKRDTEELMRIVLGTNANIWTEVFAPAFTTKCKEVVKIKVEGVLITLMQNMRAFQAQGIHFDLVNFTWKVGGSSMTDFEEDPLFSGETLKLRSLTPSVVQLCSSFESDLQILLADFQSLTDNPLKEFISREIMQGFEKFINEAHPQEESWNLFLGRFMGAVAELCNTLWKLLEKNDAIQIKQSLFARSEKCWGDCIQILVKEFTYQLDEQHKDLSPQIVSRFMPVGEVFKAEGEEFQPSIRVPLQLSHILHTLLFSICLKLSHVGPQSIPRNVRDNLRLGIGESVISHYEKLAESIEATNGQMCISPQMAMQYIFDLKFIQWFHPKLGNHVEPLSSKLQTLIDPFDWDICNPRLTINLKRFLFENHLTLGLLFSEESHGFIAQNFKTKQNQSFPMSTGFLGIQLPLLPI